MKKSPSALPVSGQNKTEPDSASGLPVVDLQYQIDDYLDDCVSGQFSPRTVAERRRLLTRLLEFLQQQGHEVCDTAQLRQFFANLTDLKTGKPMRPISADGYRRAFSAFFNWLVEERVLSQSPVVRVRRAPVKTDQITPLSLQQLEALSAAIDRLAPKVRARDRAMFLFFLETGIRCTELAELTNENLDLTHRQARIKGKGNKWRTVYLQKRTIRALFHLKAFFPGVGDTPVFRSISGLTVGEALTKSGVYQIVSSWFESAGIKGTKRGPHVLRHTYAIEYLRGGGREKELMASLGHEDLTMTHRYCNTSESDQESQARKCSPVERLKL